jgi:AraC-like DNA-binding protein
MDEDYYGAEKKVPLGVWIFHIIWITAVGIGIAAIILREHPNRWIYIQTVVYALTLGGVVWTAYLSRKTQQAMVRQINVSILPILEVTIRLVGDPDPYAELREVRIRQSRLELKNVGQGVALNVNLESLFVFTAHKYGGTNYLPLKFERLYSLSPKEVRIVQDTQPYDVAKARYQGEERTDLLSLLLGREAFHDYKLKIWFTDILGNKYVQVVHLGKQGIWSDVVQQDKGQIVRTAIRYNGVKW